MPDEQGQDDLSLEQIDGDAWGEPPGGATTLMATVYQLRRKPVGLLTAEELRVLVNQKEGLDALVPRALARLEKEPLLEGDFFPGDVLAAVLRVPRSYWSAHPSQVVTLEHIIESIDDSDVDLQADIKAFHDSVRS